MIGDGRKLGEIEAQQAQLAEMAARKQQAERAFLAAKLAENGLKLSVEADRRTLVRPRIIVGVDGSAGSKAALRWAMTQGRLVT